jgi:hypothetical protein
MRDRAGWHPAEVALVEEMAAAVRGPRREGCFALWLTVRIARDMMEEPRPPERALRRRLHELERRLATLTLPAPLRRGMTAAILHLKPGTPAAAREALKLLAAPVRESLGERAVEALRVD